MRVIGRSNVRDALAFAPSVAAFLLPLGKCPACWPAYAALLSSFGLGFLFYGRYVFPLAVAAVMFSLLTLAHGAPSRRGYGPFWVALFASLIAAAGKFLLFSPLVLWFGLLLFVLAAGWNAWPKRQVSCSKCAPQEPRSDNDEAHVLRTT